MDKGYLNLLAPEQIKEAVLLERDLAKNALNKGEYEIAWRHLEQALNRLSSSELDEACNALLISTAIEFQNICISLGKGLPDLAPILKRAKRAAELIGDKRSRALILLHQGRFYNYHGDKHDAIALFEEGKSEVEKLGDEDILNQSAELLGFYFQIKGLYTEALPRFERAARLYETEKSLQLNPLGPISLAYCYAFLGRFHQAIGTLDYYRQIALERSDHSLAVTMRAILGMVLLMINKRDEAFHELTGAWDEAKRTQNDLAYYFASGYLSYYELLEENFQKSWNALSNHTRQGQKTGLSRQYESPMKIEHIYKFSRLGLKPIPGLNYKKEIKRYLQDPNIHLKGVAHRIIALDADSKGEALARIEEELKKSERFLLSSGDPIQLAKTRLELARFKLKENDKKAAQYYAQKAWHGVAGYEDLFFPDDLRHLLKVSTPDKKSMERKEELTERFMSMIQDLAPTADLDDIMTKTVKATNRFFGAERGGLFWFTDGQNNKLPDLRGSFNLTQHEISSNEFKPHLDLISKVLQNKQPQVVRLEARGNWPHRARAILCLPFDVSGQTSVVLYHDNSYVKDCFDFLEKSMLIRLGNTLSTYVKRINDFAQRLEHSATEKLLSTRYPDKNNIVATSALMKKLIEQIDRIALSDSTVLIMGETGVGKELLAKRIHNMSRRKEAPFVLVDSTTIPENLFESEMFGYEKGAFTGADRPKAGRLELAHNGTLFIDEIGEIPKFLQSKLLRVLQEKTLIRLGGSRTIFSNFRLVVATNRDLAAEVSAGRFREDLYFRLNVVPITVPPLRDHMDDLPSLTRYFLGKYAVRYNRPMLELTPEQEAMLMEYHWPGNIREIQNIIERAVILSTDESLVIDLPAKKAVGTRHLYSDYPTMDELQRRYIKHALEKTGGKVGGAGGTAELLGMKRTTLQKRMKKLGLA
jgi:transcriptional regulator with GAF, ATPase, and Fis domain/tetratricopeptide (TPR) repeat protein